MCNKEGVKESNPSAHGRPCPVSVSLRILGLFSLLALTYYATCFISSEDTHDLQIYLDSALRLRNGDSLYQVQHRSSEQMGVFKLDYLYPPALAALIAPFTFLPRPTIVALWQFGLVIALVVSAWALARFLRVTRPDADSPFNSVTVFMLLALWPPTLDGISWGQVNGYILVLLVLAAYYAAKRNDASSGIAVGIAAALKGTPIILAIPLLVHGRWRALLYCLGAGVVAHLPLLLYPNGIQAIPEFVAASKLITAGDLVNDPSNDYSLRRLVLLLTELPVFFSSVLSVCIIGIFALVTAWQRRLHSQGASEIAGLCGLQMVSAIPVMMLASPLVWSHHLVWLFPVLLVLKTRTAWSLATWFSVVSYLVLAALLYVHVFIRYYTSYSELFLKPVPIVIICLSYLLLCVILGRSKFARCH